MVAENCRSPRRRPSAAVRRAGCAAAAEIVRSKGSKPAIRSPLDESGWKEWVALLETEHRRLRAEVASFPIERLHDFPDGGKVRFAHQLSGIALHDVYHAGQIQLLKRLQAGSA